MFNVQNNSHFLWSSIIDKYFDTRGWIILENDNHLNAITKINKITKNHYNKYLNIVENNYNICIKNKYYSHHIFRYNDILKKLPEFR